MKEKILIDDCDLYLLDKYKWYIGVYVKRIENKKTIYLHRVIMKDEIEKFEKNNKCRAYIDHINRNPLDNRRCNLRVVNQNDNIMNRDKQSTNTSGYKGINLTVSGTYHVCIKYNKIRYRKTLKSIQEAIKWREDKIKELNIFEGELIDDTKHIKKIDDKNKKI